MIKSELVQRISMASPHLYRRDAEKVVNAILDEITTAMARGDRVELRGDRGHAAENFFQGGSPKTGHPTSAPGPPHGQKSFLTRFPRIKVEFINWTGMTR